MVLSSNKVTFYMKIKLLWSRTFTSPRSFIKWIKKLCICIFLNSTFRSNPLFIIFNIFIIFYVYLIWRILFYCFPIKTWGFKSDLVIKSKIIFILLLCICYLLFGYWRPSSTICRLWPSFAWPWFKTKFVMVVFSVSFIKWLLLFHYNFIIIFIFLLVA